MIKFSTDLHPLEQVELVGFFVGWPNPPSINTFKKILQNSQHIVLALEVLPSHQVQGIRKELTRRMLTELESYYMVDLSCDDNVVPFYERLGLRKNNSMFIRNYKFQSGRN